MKNYSRGGKRRNGNGNRRRIQKNYHMSRGGIRL